MTRDASGWPGRDALVQDAGRARQLAVMYVCLCVVFIIVIDTLRRGASVCKRTERHLCLPGLGVEHYNAEATWRSKVFNKFCRSC